MNSPIYLRAAKNLKAKHRNKGAVPSESYLVKLRKLYKIFNKGLLIK